MAYCGSQVAKKYGGVPVTICVATAADSDIRSTVVVVLPIMSTPRYASSTIKNTNNRAVVELVTTTAQRSNNHISVPEVTAYEHIC